jgi:hypothetical protein
MKLRKVVLLLTMLYLPTAQVAAQPPAHPEGATPSRHSKRLVPSYGKLPLVFELSEAQDDRPTHFLSRAPGYSLCLTADEAVLALHTNAGSTQSRPSGLSARRISPGTVALRMKLLRANRKATFHGLGEMPGKVNYFLGNDPKKWRTNVPTFGRVEYKEVYPGIDLIYRGNHRQLEYDFVVAQGADPGNIELQFQGAENTQVDRRGDLLIRLAGTTIRQPRPVVYQKIGGTRRNVNGAYVMSGKDRVRFRLASYDRTHTLIIDPKLSYSTFLGGSDEDRGLAIAVDTLGNVYVTGGTASTDFPITSNAPEPGFSGGIEDAFVTKLNPSGSALLYSTYIGGSGTDFGLGIAVDSAGNAYVTGYTDSTDFPATAGAFQTSSAGGFGDAFVYKLNPSGSALVYSTYVGGSQSDEGSAIAVDRTGNAYVSGQSLSSDFPVTHGALQTSFGGVEDATVFKLNASGSALVYSTYLGGSSDETASGIAVDSSGNAYVTGFTESTDFRTTPGALQETFGGDGDAFVSKLNPTGSALVYSSYLGGSSGDSSTSIAIDATGNAYVVGETISTDFPTTSGALQTTADGTNEGFVTKLNTTGSHLAYSTYLGGSGGFTSADSIAVDALGNAYVTGATFSAHFPVTLGAFQTSYAGCGDAFLSRVNAGGSMLLYSTYLGGSGVPDCEEDEDGQGVAVDNAGNAYVTGPTESTNFPTTPGAFQTAFGGGFSDAFVSKFSFGIGPPRKIQDCKKGGWRKFTIPSKFKNQGDCVSFVTTGK